jgi:hypothetical protein
MENVYPHVGKVFFTPRQVAQYVGSEILRTLDEDIHCKGLMASAPDCEILVVTDIRFPNELEFFKNQGVSFIPAYVHNGLAEARAARDTHQSESHLASLAASCGHTLIDNNSTILKLKFNIEEVLTSKLGGLLRRSKAAT